MELEELIKMITLILVGNKDGRVFDKRVIKGMNEKEVYHNMVHYISEKIYNEVKL